MRETDHVDPLVSDSRIDDGPLAVLLNLDRHLAALILIRNQRCNIGLDTTSSEANDDDCSCVATERMAMRNGGWQRSSPQDQKADPVYTAEDQNRLVFAQVLIGDDGTKDGCHVAEELEEDIEASRSLLS